MPCLAASACPWHLSRSHGVDVGVYRQLGLAVTKSAGVGAAVSGLMAIVALAFPALIPLAAPVMAPLAVLGFCAVGGKVVRLSKGWYELYRDVTALGAVLETGLPRGGEIK